MNALSVDGVSVHYREAGDGPPVVLLHGGASSSAQWRDVLPQLVQRYRIITIDFHGHGQTSAWPGAVEARTHEADARLVTAVIEDRVRQPVHLVGHSYGGAVALRLVIEDAAWVKDLVLIEPQAWSMLLHGGERELHEEGCRQAREFTEAARRGRAEEAWRASIDATYSPGTWARMPAKTRERLLSLTETAISVYHANMNHSTTPAECRALALPTLVLVGGSTSPRYRRMTELVAECIAGARLEVLPGAGHMSPVTHPRAVAAALERHLPG